MKNIPTSACWRAILAAALLFAVSGESSQGQKTLATPSLSQNFKRPPSTAHPWVFWMWLRVQTNHEAITRDLEAMHDKGIEGAILYDSGVGGGMEADRRMVVGHKGFYAQPTKDYSHAHFTPIPEPPMPSWQPASRELVRFAAKEAARLGVKLVLTVGLASTSGPIALEDSQQRLVWSRTTVQGGAAIDQQLAPLTHAVPPSLAKVHSYVPERENVGAHPSEQHPIAVLAIPAGKPYSTSSVIDVSAFTGSDGRLHWRAPAGSWRIYRFAYEPTHMSNAWGLYTDAMSSTALDHTWDVTIGKILSEMSPSERRGLYGVEDDSWEAGPSTWTGDFTEQFQQRRSYNLIPWLPVLAGEAVANAQEADGIRRDFYRTIADLIAQNHYAHLAQLARKNGLVSFSEAAGPNSGELDPEFNAAHIDVPMGEVWMPSQHRPTPERRFLMHDAASSAHVYGQRVIGCEVLTSVGPQWEESFFDMKSTADRAFTEGCNLDVIHNFSQSPSVDAKPGYVYFAGTYYNRNVTWWDQTPAFNAYLGRISFLLQQGHFAADALYYRGDAIGQIEQLKQPLPEAGYEHDNINLDALLHRLSFKDGRLVLPDGMSYRLLVLDSTHRLALPALLKIESLVRAGAIVVGSKPMAADGLLTPAQQREFDETVAHLWGADATSGFHVRTEPVAEVLDAMHLTPDLSIDGVSPEGEFDWIHRDLQHAQVYFIASRWDAIEHITATFRVRGMQPEIWDPVTGEMRDAVAFHQQDGFTTVPLQFSPRGSVFVVFRRNIPSDTNGTAASNEAEAAFEQSIAGPWRVHFDPHWGGPANVVFNTLDDWAKRPEENIRHYSGTAVYSNTFTLAHLPKHGETLLLNLGEVHEEAEVRVNGVKLGVVWTKPATIDISRAVRFGKNTLDISVVNLWPNRLIGDESLPPAKRFTTTNAHKFDPTTPLLPSGLLGPVTLDVQNRTGRAYSGR